MKGATDSTAASLATQAHLRSLEVQCTHLWLLLLLLLGRLDGSGGGRHVLGGSGGASGGGCTDVHRGRCPQVARPAARAGPPKGAARRNLDGIPADELHHRSGDATATIPQQKAMCTGSRERRQQASSSLSCPHPASPQQRNVAVWLFADHSLHLNRSIISLIHPSLPPQRHGRPGRRAPCRGTDSITTSSSSESDDAKVAQAGSGASSAASCRRRARSAGCLYLVCDRGGRRRCGHCGLGWTQGRQGAAAG